MKKILLLALLLYAIAFPQRQNDFLKYAFYYSSKVDTVWDEVIVNGTFNTNLYGWVFYNDASPIIYEWVASGGGFTGAVHLKNDFNNSGLQTNVSSVGSYSFQVGEVYKFSCDVNIVSGAGTYARPRIYSPVYYVNLTYQGPQTAHIEIQFTVSTASTTAYIWVQQGSATITEWYVDNVSLKRRRIIH